jgi:hypothetical protein
VATTDERDGSPVDTARLTRAEGDDIVVVPAEVDEPVGLSRRHALAGAAIVSILVVIVAVALFTRHSRPTTAVRTASPAASAPVPVVDKTPAKVKPKSSPPAAIATVASTSAPTTVAAAVPPATVSAATTPATPVPTTAAPPKQYPPSALTWDQPHRLTIPAGSARVLPVTAHNPTNGTVDLPHPLSCAPRLDHSEMCPEMVQQIGPGQSASAQYTIDAKGIAKGTYTLSIEGVLTVQVTVS